MSGALPEGTWRVDAARSRVAFHVRHLGLSTVHGSFGEFAGELRVDAGELVASGSVRAASIDTGDGLRDSMLPGPNFLGAQGEPEIAYRGRLSPPPAARDFELPGELTIAGQARPLALSLSVADEGSELAIAGGGLISRSDYGLRFRGPMAAGDRAVGDRVTVELQLRLVPGA